MAWAPDYTTPEDLAAFVRIGDTADDVQLGLAIAAASRAIDRACDRQFGVLAAAAPRYYTARWDVRRCRWVVKIDDLMTTTDLVVDVAADEDLDYDAGGEVTSPRLEPVNAAADGRPWTSLVVPPASAVQPSCLEHGVRITALWGWSAVPPAVEEACLLQASRLLSRRDSPLGVAGSPEAGSELRLLARLDPDVAVALRPFRRVWGAV
jgi:hypothetical protein